MNVEELLDMLEETLEEGTAVPFAAAKRVVDVDAAAISWMRCAITCPMNCATAKRLWQTASRF